MDLRTRHLSLNRCFQTIPLLLLLSLVLPAVSARCEGSGQILFRDDFMSLDQWKPLVFPKIPKHTVYAIEKDDRGSYLRAESDGSASAIVYRHDFNPYDYPKIRWRWKISNVYRHADARKKSGDDYPVRIYVIFRYSPEKASFRDSITYGIAKARYGEYPPQSSLNYIWADRDYGRRIMPNPYTDRAQMIVLEHGAEKTGTWVEEEINILDDYRQAFGTEPPAEAGLAIMNDSDNTGEHSVSYVDSIEVFR
jgi:hypothetical protein